MTRRFLNQHTRYHILPIWFPEINLLSRYKWRRRRGAFKDKLNTIIDISRTSFSETNLLLPFNTLQTEENSTQLPPTIDSLQPNRGKSPSHLVLSPTSQKMFPLRGQPLTKDNIGLIISKLSLKLKEIGEKSAVEVALKESRATNKYLPVNLGL